MKKNNLLILCHELSPIGGGAGNFTNYLVREFEKKEYFSNIAVITSNYKAKYPLIEKRGNVQIYRLPIFRKFADRTDLFELFVYTVVSFIAGLILFLKYHFKFTLAIHGIPSGISAFLLFKSIGASYGVSLRGGDIPGFLPEKYSLFHKRTHFITKIYWKRAKFITFNVEDAYNLTKKLADKLNKDIYIIPNGVDCDFFAPGLEKKYDVINILYSGRLTEQKNVELLIKAVKLVKNKLGGVAAPFEVKIAGEGNLRKSLESTVSGLGLEGYVKFYGWLDKKRLKSLYQSSHLFILPSLYEGMSNSLLEAMACGMAVISTDFKGYEKLIYNGENGYLIGSNDLEELSDKMCYLLKNIDIIKKMERRSREIALGFSWQEAGNRYLKLISKEIAF